MKLGRFVTIQAKSTEQETLEIGKILVHVTAPHCSAADEEKDLCTLFNDADDYDEAQFNMTRILIFCAKTGHITVVKKIPQTINMKVSFNTIGINYDLSLIVIRDHLNPEVVY